MNILDNATYTKDKVLVTKVEPGTFVRYWSEKNREYYYYLIINLDKDEVVKSHFYNRVICVNLSNNRLSALSINSYVDIVEDEIFFL